MYSPERLAEVFYDLLRDRQAGKFRYPVDRLPNWVDLPSLSRQDLVLLFRESLRIMALDEDEQPKWKRRY